MTLRRRLATAMLSGLLIVGGTAAAKAPVEWDGLQRVPSKKLQFVYIQPGADFRGYTKVMLDPTEVAFHKNWQRDYNSSNRSLSSRVSDSEVQDAITKGVAAGTDIFTDAWRKGGYEIVTTPGPDVLRVRTAVTNISVRAPERQTAGRSYSFSEEAGHATLVVEVRDSTTGAILGRAVDGRVAGDNTVGRRTSVSNRGDFRDLVQDWANDSVRGMAELKRLSPVK